MQGKDIAKAPARLLNDVGGRVLSAPERSIEPVEPWIQPIRRDLVEAPEIGHNARTSFAAVVPKSLDQLQVLAPPGLGD